MIERHEYKKLVWVDMQSPTPEETRQVAHEFGLNPRVADELLLPTLKPHTDSHGTHLYLVLHFPTLFHPGKQPEREVDFIIGKNFLITTRYEPIHEFTEFKSVFMPHSVLEEDVLGDHALTLFMLLTKRMYQSVEAEIDEVRDTLEDIERDIFEGKEREMVIALSKAGRDILNLKQSLDPHEEVLRSLVELTEKFAGREYVGRIRNLEDIYYRARKHITRIWQSLNELRETNNSLLGTKQNEVMKTLTIMAFVTFPLSLVAAIFGMNTNNIPIIGHPNDFWIVVGMMGFATVLMFIYFKHKHWL